MPNYQSKGFRFKTYVQGAEGPMNDIKEVVDEKVKCMEKQSLITFDDPQVYSRHVKKCAYPLLIYHQEGSNFDAESIIQFIGSEYMAQEVTVPTPLPGVLEQQLKGTGVGISPDKINKISINDYFSFWNSFKDVVYVDDNYELGLLASTYASLINAPLVIRGTSLDSENVFKGRNVICVGGSTPTGGCDSRYFDVDSIMRKYLTQAGTKRFIVTNPDDLGIYTSDTLQADDSGNVVTKLYTKHSLVAPILASAKEELIMPITPTNYGPADAMIKSRFQSLGLLTSVQTYTCEAGESCSEGFSETEPGHFQSTTTTFFNFANLDNSKDFHVTVWVEPEGIPIDLYINDKKIALAAQKLYNPKTAIVEGSELSEGSLQVKITPDYTFNVDGREYNLFFPVAERPYSARVEVEQQLQLPYFMTVLAGHTAIPNQEMVTYAGGVSSVRSTDQSRYSDFSGNSVPDLAIGRIMGLTPSDTSAYTARAIWYDQLPGANKVTSMASMSSDLPHSIVSAERIQSAFGQLASYSTVAYLQETEDLFIGTPDMWEDAMLISYHDHGFFDGVGTGIKSKDLPPQHQSFVLLDACSTCNSGDGLSVGQFTADSFCANLLRKGVIAYTGNVYPSLAGATTEMMTLNNVYYKDLPLGVAYNKAYEGGINTDMNTLIGDPTIKIKVPQRLSEPMVPVYMEKDEHGHSIREVGA